MLVMNVMLSVKLIVLAIDLLFLVPLLFNTGVPLHAKIPEGASGSRSPPLVARKGCQGRRVWTTIAPSCETPIRGWTRPLPVGKDPRPSRMRRLDRTGVELALEESSQQQQQQRCQEQTVLWLQVQRR